MTFIGLSTTTATVTIKVSDAQYAEGTDGSKFQLEIRKGTSITTFNPATVSYTGSAGVWVMNIASVPVGGTVAGTDEGLYTIIVRKFGTADADTSTTITELGRAIFNKVSTTTTVACF